jgi:hypothetical protein
LAKDINIFFPAERTAKQVAELIVIKLQLLTNPVRNVARKLAATEGTKGGNYNFTLHPQKRVLVPRIPDF